MRKKTIDLELYRQKIAEGTEVHPSEIKCFISAGSGYFIRESVKLKGEDFKKGINIILPKNFYSISQSFWEILFEHFIEDYNTLEEFHEKVKFSGSDNVVVLMSQVDPAIERILKYKRIEKQKNKTF